MQIHRLPYKDLVYIMIAFNVSATASLNSEWYNLIELKQHSVSCPESHQKEESDITKHKSGEKNRICLEC